MRLTKSLVVVAIVIASASTFAYTATLVAGAANVTVPAAPTQVTAIADNSSAIVSWLAPSDRDSPITVYVVTPFVAGVARKSTVYPTARTTDTVTGLTNGVAYTFAVAATNANGTGGLSWGSNSIIPATLPDAPSDVVATAGNQSATVTWATPNSNGYPVIAEVVTAYTGGIALHRPPWATTLPAPRSPGSQTALGTHLR